jgi:soluble lytic murein transglycosylase-like protein
MKSVYALIPAALLAGTVLSAPVEAKRTEDPTVQAERVSAKKKLFKSTAAKTPAKVKKVAGLKTRKAVSNKSKTASRKRKVVSETHKTASLKPKSASETRKTASLKPKSASETRKTASLKPKSVSEPRKTASLKPRKLVATKKRKVIQAAAAKPAEIKKPRIARFDRTSMTKVLRSGPREVGKLAPIKTTLMAEKASPATGGSEVEVTAIIREMAPSYGVPTWFALRIANVESGYNPYVRGRAGEYGVYQLKCQTARGMGFEGDCSGLFDARTNVRWGLKHLSLAIASSGGNLRLAASKHNGGLGRKSLVEGYIAKVF